MWINEYVVFVFVFLFEFGHMEKILITLAAHDRFKTSSHPILLMDQVLPSLGLLTAYF
jgi:hypothetical protein